MDAQLVWDTWRRVLTNDQLVEWVLHPADRADVPDGLTADELAILDEYARTPAATHSNIGMYRSGLVRNALGALDLVPLTRRLLSTSSLDMNTVARDFVRSSGYADNGPYFWRTAAGFVSYLARLPEFVSPAQQDVLALDAATISLARRLSEHTTTVWPARAAAVLSGSQSAPEDPGRFVASAAAVAVSSRCDLTAWMEDPFDFDPGKHLEPSPGYWLVYFPAAEAPHEYAKLSERAARSFDLLRTPKTELELSLALDGLPITDVNEIVESLAELGVVAKEETCSA